jgi:hypothetical protein
VSPKHYDGTDIARVIPIPKRRNREEERRKEGRKEGRKREREGGGNRE